MTHKFLVAIIFVVLGISIWAFQKPRQLAEIFKNYSVTLQDDQKSGSNILFKKDNSIFEKKLHQEAELIGRIDSAPEDTEERLQNWAKTLNDDDFEQLEATALNLQKPQDDRFLAVMLMAWSEKAEALENLRDIALAEVDPYLSPNRMGDFERVLRMQAIDGMLDLRAQPENIANTLHSVAAKTGDTTIADRAQRALWNIRGDAKIPKDQDEAALESLLKKPKRN